MAAADSQPAPEPELQGRNISPVASSPNPLLDPTGKAAQLLELDQKQSQSETVHMAHELLAALARSRGMRQSSDEQVLAETCEDTEPATVVKAVSDGGLDRTRFELDGWESPAANRRNGRIRDARRKGSVS